MENPPPAAPRERFRIGDWSVEPDLDQVSRADQCRRLEPKLMELLVYLAERPGQTIARDEILGAVWDGKAVIDAVLTRGISEIRQTLGDDPQQPRFIQTVPRKGYRLIAAVTAAPDAAAPNAVAALPAASAGSRAAARRLSGWLAGGALLVVVTLFASRYFPAGNEDRSVRWRSIAVLPFDNHSGDSRQEYLAAGMTEALITELAQIRGLRVISRTSVQQYRGAARPLPAIGRELGVETIVVGSVLEAGDRVRITVQLILAESDEHLWAESFDRDTGDVLALHAEIAHAVLREIRVHLSPREQQRLTRPGTTDAEAHRLYLKGRYYWNRRTVADMRASVALFEQAIERDPGYARAHAGLADAYLQLSNYYAMPPREAFPRARQAVERALEIDPYLAEAHATQGAVAVNQDWNFIAAEEAFRRALRLGPGYVTAHQWYAELLSFLGRHDEALAEIAKAWELDPFSPLINAAWGQRLSAAGRFREALERFRDTLELEPRFAWIYREMAYAFTELGEHDRAVAARLREMETRGVADDALRRAVEDRGMRGFWSWHRDRLTRRRSTAWVPAALLAEAHAGAGDREQALGWFESAVEEGGEVLLHLRRSPAFAELSSEPRYLALHGRFGLR